MTTAKQLRSFIDRLCDEEEYESVEGRWSFRSGGDCGHCADSAMKVAAAFGGHVVGYTASKNPSARIGLGHCEGHDFAIIGGRFIVDYWAFRVAKLIGTPVFDLSNPGERATVRVLYGDERTWENVPLVNKENPHHQFV